MTNIEAAIGAINAPEPGEPFTYTEIAKRFGVNRSTLSQRHRGHRASRAEGYQKLKLLHLHQEQALIAYINRLTDRGLPPTQSMI
ncbi:hypothetical protein COCCADRAFT_76527, partial [Bipolaris zeicola 26-R-13]